MSAPDILLQMWIFILFMGGLVWLAMDTHKNLMKKYGTPTQATDADVDKFLRENEGLMNDLASGQMPLDSVWILSYEMYLDANAGGTWIRVREGVLLDGPTAYTNFERLQKQANENPLYMRSVICERAKVIR